MLKKLLFAAAIFCSGSNLFAQSVPNGGFETWGAGSFGLYENPAGWFTLNDFIGIYNMQNPPRPYSTFKSQLPYAGSFAAKVESVIMTDAWPISLPGVTRDTAGIMFCGTLDLSAGTIKGFPVNKRFSTMSFHYMYSGVNQDSVFASVILYKHDGTNSVQIGSGERFFGNAQAFTEAIIPINYSSALTPDTAMIIISSTKMMEPELGSVLYVDEVKLNTPANINSYAAMEKFEMFPNPATTNVTIKASGTKAALVNITDLTGRIVKEAKLENGQVTIETAELPSSIYIISILDAQKGLLGTSKLTRK
jgi:hypothetical protein